MVPHFALLGCMNIAAMLPMMLASNTVRDTSGNLHISRNRIQCMTCLFYNVTQMILAALKRSLSHMREARKFTLFRLRYPSD